MPTHNFQPTSVNASGLTALIRNLGRDCLPTQFLREYTKNAIEACQRTKEKEQRIFVDFNEALFEGKSLHKICFIDNGEGMSEEQMLSLLNSLSASGTTQNEYENYGVGAKISALTRNHAGILYESWREGTGYAVLIRYNEELGIYGIEGAEVDGRTVYAQRLRDSARPSMIAKHGTRVTLFGMTETQDTMLPPEGVSGIRESWIALYLNSRFFTIPSEIELYARIGYYRDVSNSRHNYLARIWGQKKVLDEAAQEKGVQRLDDATLYWWIMPKGTDGHGRALVKGHTALINQGEIFDISDSRSNRSAHFGVIFGRDRVVIYVEPDNVVQNTARTGLVRPDGSAIVWDRWQDQFRENMPDALRNFLDSLLDENSRNSHTDSIRERLKTLRELYKISRYRSNREGSLQGDPNSAIELNTGYIKDGDLRDSTSRSNRGRGSGAGSLATTLLSALVEEGESGVPVIHAQPDPFPKVTWTTVQESPQITDRAAEYVPTENRILANKDFQGLQDLVNYFGKSHSEFPEVQQMIREVVTESFEQALMECVAGALSLKGRAHWNNSDFETAISKEALTTAVMQRYWMVSHIKRILGSKIKGFNEQLSQQEAA